MLPESANPLRVDLHRDVRAAVESVLRRHQAFPLLQGREGVRSLLAEMEAMALNTPAAASAISNGV